MLRFNHAYSILFILLVVAGALALIPPRPTSACIDLKGNAAWFYRSCRAVEPDPAASWRVQLIPKVPGHKSLSMGVENAYPGYQLECDLFLANNGKIPFIVKSVNTLNPNPSYLILSAAESPAGKGKAIKPCGYTPAWGTNPARVPLSCRSKIHLSLTMSPDAEQDSAYPFTVQVRLQENKRNH